MKVSFQKISAFLGSRLFRNILFWVIIIYFEAFSNVHENRQQLGIIYLGKAISIATYIFLTYFNNLYLVPKFLRKRKTVKYLLSASLLVIVLGFGHTLFVKSFISFFPPIKDYQIIFLSSPISSSWSVASIINSSMGYAFTFALWILVFTMAWYMNDYSRQSRIAAAAEKKQIETELSFLKSQINPHFLFNTLNNLYALALQKSDDAPDAILKLSSILRYLLYESNVPTVPFEKEKEVMQAYIELELLRLEQQDSFNFRIEADGNYDIPPLLWLPILENVFKHGTRVIANQYYIDYQFIIKNSVLQIYAKNNCKFLNGKNHLEKVGGIGLTNISKRLSLLYPERHSIQTNQGNNYFVTEIQIDLKNESNKRIDN